MIPLSQPQVHFCWRVETFQSSAYFSIISQWHGAQRCNLIFSHAVESELVSERSCISSLSLGTHNSSVFVRLSVVCPGRYSNSTAALATGPDATGTLARRRQWGRRGSGGGRAGTARRGRQWSSGGGVGGEIPQWMMSCDRSNARIHQHRWMGLLSSGGGGAAWARVGAGAVARGPAERTPAGEACSGRRVDSDRATRGVMPSEGWSPPHR